MTNITDKNPGTDLRIVEVKYVGSDLDFYIRPGNGVWSVILNTTLDYDQVNHLVLHTLLDCHSKGQ